MSALLKRYPVLFALAAAAVILLAIVAFEIASGWAFKSDPAAAAPRANVVQAKLLPPIVAEAPEQIYPETAARPLFTPTRRAAPAAPTVGASTMTKGQFVLNGVTIAGRVRIALLREKTSGRVLRVEQGRDVNGITVSRIETDRVTLSQGSDEEVVTLQVQKGGMAAASVPAGPFAGATPTAAAEAAQAQPAQLQAQPVTNPAANPAARGPVPAFVPPGVGFGPLPQPPPSPAAAPSTQSQAPSSSNPTVSMSPEELLARRRARRTQ
jgi:hypothetical protein